MSDFEAFSEEIEGGMDYLEHHGILGMKWGKLNGPPYPLGSGDHSSAEKSAAKAAGVSVGSDSGKGSIENVKKSGTSSKSPKKVMTEEEKREAALNAARTGDKKKIAKYMDYLTTQELQEAETRARVKSSMTREEAGEKKTSKAEMEKMEAIRSGDKEKIKQYADKMSNQELREAMDRVDLNAKLNYVTPPKSAMDKLKDVANKVDDFRQVAEKGVNAYNLAAKVYNSTHKDGAQWPIIENKQNNNNEKNKEADIAKNLLSQVTKDVSNTVKEKSYEQQAKEKLEKNKIDYKTQKEFNEWKDKQENKENKGTKKEEKTENVFNLDKETANRKVNDYDGPSYDELIPDDVKDIWNRKVS